MTVIVQIAPRPLRGKQVAGACSGACSASASQKAAAVLVSTERHAATFGALFVSISGRV